MTYSYRHTPLLIFCVRKNFVHKVSSHHFKWWFIISPKKGWLRTRLKGGYRKHCYWSSIKRYFWFPLSLTLLSAPGYISLLHLLLYYRLLIHNILSPRMTYPTYFAALDACHRSSVCFSLSDIPLNLICSALAVSLHLDVYDPRILLHL